MLPRTVDRVLQETGAAIQNGGIAAVPLEGDRSPCRYCSYKAVCLKEENAAVRKVEKLKHSEAVKKLYEEAGV